MSEARHKLLRDAPNASSASPRYWIRQGIAVLTQAVRDLFVDGGPQWAAAIAYYSLLSAFPLLLAGASIAAFFVDPQRAVAQASELLAAFVPRGLPQIEAIVTDAIAARESVGLLSLAALLWTGSRVFGAVTKALNIAYDVDEAYGFLKRTLIEFAMVATIGLLFVLALASRLLLGLLWDSLSLLPAERGLLFRAIEIIAPAVLLLITFFLTYRFVPRGRQDWRAALVGSGAATLLVLAARPLFLRYVRDFGQYNLIYGSVAVAVILVLWAWVVALILLFGGELASHVQAMAIEGQAAEQVARQHQERSPTHPRKST